jgi:environmental stress-induced protein Ves
MKVLREAQYIAVPWKNGGGVTREIHREPPEPAPFDWRLSLATIGSAGPFSAFDGYDRTLTLVRGVGVEMTFHQHGNAKLSSVGQMAQFDGGWQTSCALLDGPSTDLNLIVSRTRAVSTSRSVQILTPLTISTAQWTQTIVCCISGSIQIANTGATAELAAVDVALCSPSDGMITCHPSGPVAAHVFIAGVKVR